MKTIKSFALLLIATATLSLGSCVVRGQGWVQGHYDYGAYGGRHWVPGHYN
jgi:hypothetical protein